MLKRHPYIVSSIILFVLILIFTVLLRNTQRFSMLEEGVIGLIEIEGVITDPDPIVVQIKKMNQIDSVRGVIVRLNSPGGGVAASQEIYDAINELKRSKKVYSSMGTVAASGAYYIACASDKIFANPGTITGSIGVILKWYNFKELSEKIGAKPIIIKSVENKNLMPAFRKIGESERFILQQLVDDTHEQFVQAIVKGRTNLNEAQIRTFSDGRVFAGDRAKKEGLIDELASYSQVIRILGRDVGLKGKIRTVRFDKEEFAWTALMKQLFSLKQFLPSSTGISLNYILQ